MTSRTHLPKNEIGAHFLTAKTFENTPFFRDPACTLIFCEELEAARKKYDFHVLAFVVMPDHVHLLLWWDKDSKSDLTISKVAWAVKGLTAKRVVNSLQDRVGEGSVFTHPSSAFTHPSSGFTHPAHSDWLKQVRKPQDIPHRRNWRYKVWQQGAGYEFNVYSRHKLQQKVVYIHANPVRAGLVAAPSEYPWSIASNYFWQGVGKGTVFAHPEPAHSVQITCYAEVL